MVSACMNEFGAGTLGKDGADFSVFFIEGIIEYYWDLPYAPSIVTLFPHWLKSVYSAQPVFRRYFRDAWGSTWTERRMIRCWNLGYRRSKKPTGNSVFPDTE